MYLASIALLILFSVGGRGAAERDNAKELVEKDQWFSEPFDELSDIATTADMMNSFLQHCILA